MSAMISLKNPSQQGILICAVRLKIETKDQATPGAENHEIPENQNFLEPQNTAQNLKITKTMYNMEIEREKNNAKNKK
jgi:hypothetical protein